MDFTITYKPGSVKLTAFLDANLGNNSDNGKSTFSYLVFLTDAPISFKVGLQGLTAQSAMEAELATAALTINKAVFFSNMVKELVFVTCFDSVPLHLDNTSALNRKSGLHPESQARDAVVLLHPGADEGRPNE